MATNTTTIYIRNILKKTAAYKAFANKPVAFCFDIYGADYLNKDGSRGKIIKVNNVYSPIDNPIENIPVLDIANHLNAIAEWQDPGKDRVKLETVKYYSKFQDWEIPDPRKITTTSPYMFCYKYIKYYGIGPNGETNYYDGCLKAVVFGFIGSDGVPLDIPGTCAQNIQLEVSNDFVPKKLTGCRIDANTFREDCPVASYYFNFTNLNSNPNYTGLDLEIGDIPIQKI